MSDSPLHTIETLLSSTYASLFAVSNEWGKVNDEQKADFHAELDCFTNNITAALESLSGGLELRRPSSEQIKSYDTMDTRNFAQRINQNPEMIPHFEELLGEWCDEIESYLNAPDRNSTQQESTSKNTSRVTDNGPKGELEYWRTRMQRLTSITEQLKRKDCKNVIGLLSALTKGSGDQSKSKIILLLRRWKQIDIGITEAANEAKDNVKYLFTLQRFIEPLYSGTAQSVIDTLPALMNSIKVSH
eukprot:14025192-Ditylum_brightwellii.AAC.1